LGITDILVILKGRGQVQMVKHLPSKGEALSLNLNTLPKKKKKPKMLSLRIYEHGYLSTYLDHWFYFSEFCGFPHIYITHNLLEI
jgi:hypothetical protein